MRKSMVFIIVSTLLVTFSLGLIGCEDQEATGEPEAADSQAEAASGTITAVSDADDKGYVEAEVTFEDGAINDVALTEFRDTGFQKDDDYDYEPFQEASEILPERFVEANDYDVDVVTEATGTSEKAMQAVERAIARSQGDTAPFEGTFLGFSEIDDRDARNMAWVTLQDGEIVDVELQEYYDVHEGEIKDEDYDYETWHEAYEEMPGRFVEAGEVDEVDVFTEATSSSEKWKEAVSDALEKAEAQ